MIVKCGFRYINMDQVRYIQFEDELNIYLIYFDWTDNQDECLVFDEEDECEAIKTWLERNSA